MEKDFEAADLRTYSFHPCKDHIVLWIPGAAMCDDFDAKASALAPHLPQFDLVSCIVYTMDTLYPDCRSGRLPRERCQERIEGLLGKERCGGVGKSEQREIALTALQLGLIRDVDEACK